MKPKSSFDNLCEVLSDIALAIFAGIAFAAVLSGIAMVLDKRDNAHRSIFDLYQSP